MSNKVYSFHDIDAIIDNPPEELSSRASRSGRLTKNSNTNSQNQLLEKFITDLKQFTDTIPDSLKQSHPKINNAIALLEQRAQYLKDPHIETAAVIKLLTEITSILLQEFESISNTNPSAIKDNTTQLIQSTVETLKLLHKNETEKFNHLLDSSFLEE